MKPGSYTGIGKFPDQCSQTAHLAHALAVQQLRQHSPVESSRAITNLAEKLNLHVNVSYLAGALAHTCNFFQRFLLFFAELWLRILDKTFNPADGGAQPVHTFGRDVLLKFGNSFEQVCFQTRGFLLQF